MKTRMKMLAVAALPYAPLAMARENPSYPREKFAAFVVEKLDVTTLPSAYRPKKENGKKIKITVHPEPPKLQPCGCSAPGVPKYTPSVDAVNYLGSHHLAEARPEG